MFISHNHQDKEFVRRLSPDLREDGFSVCLKGDIVSVGENNGLTRLLIHWIRAMSFLVVLPENSYNSKFKKLRDYLCSSITTKKTSKI
jgi:hypothetical protein